MSTKTEKKIIIYGKGKAMQAVCGLLGYLEIGYVQMDDEDADVIVLQSAKTIIATPGIKPTHRLYNTYSKKIVSELSFLGKLLKEKRFARWTKNTTTIGITGTNGKSTTTWILYQLLGQGLGSQDGLHIHIGGNFDRPLSGIIHDILIAGQTADRHIIVLECSSFMLWQLRDFVFDVGVLLNIASDHIDRHGDMKAYLQSKVNILLRAKKSITNTDIKQHIIDDQMRGLTFIHKLRSFASSLQQPYQWQTYEPLAEFEHPGFPGLHNAYNFGAVYAIVQHLYPTLVAQPHRYDRIEPVAHRLQSLTLADGVTIIDDSVSSSAHALGAALESVLPPIILIAGGYDNGESYDHLLPLLDTKVRVGIFYGQTRIHLYPLGKQVITDTFMVETLAEAIDLAFEYSKKLNLTTILYSPGAKSFDQYYNVYERIADFEKLVSSRETIGEK